MDTIYGWMARRPGAARLWIIASIMESLGHPVRMFEGSYENIKVTTAGDLVVVEAFLRDLTQSDLQG